MRKRNSEVYVTEQTLSKRAGGEGESESEGEREIVRERERERERESDCPSISLGLSVPDSPDQQHLSGEFGFYLTY